MDGSPPGSSVHGDSPGQNTGVGGLSLLQGNLPNPGIESRSPTLQADSLPAELPRKPKNTEVGSLSLCQVNFLIRESNWGLLHSKNTGVGSLSFLQGIFQTQEIEPGSPIFQEHWSG